MADNFHGMATQTLENEHVRLDYLVEAGPRLVRFSPAGSSLNLLVDVFGFKVPTPYGEYSFLGGHRLWQAPESLSQTYTPDLTGLRVVPVPRGVCLLLPADPHTGIAKSLELQLSPDRPAVTLQHTLTNGGTETVRLAPWAITQLRLGGVGILPLLPGPSDPDGLLPNRQITCWPYTSLRDTRLVMENEAILVRGVGSLPPLKIGTRNPAGWLGYWLEGILFIKRFTFEPVGLYPDFGCNAEVYCGDKFQELESLGPLEDLAPGHSIHHGETWELYPDWDQPFLPEAVRALLERELR